MEFIELEADEEYGREVSRRSAPLKAREKGFQEDPQELLEAGMTSSSEGEQEEEEAPPPTVAGTHNGDDASASG